MLCPRFAVIRAGRLRAVTTPAKARESLAGTIFEGTVEPDEYEALRHERSVTQAYLVEGRNRVRVYEPEGSPPPGFVAGDADARRCLPRPDARPIAGLPRRIRNRRGGGGLDEPPAILAVFGRDLSQNSRRSMFFIWVALLVFMAWSLSSGKVRIQSGDSSVGGDEGVHHLGVRRRPAARDLRALDLWVLRVGRRRDGGDPRRGMPGRRDLARHSSAAWRVHLGQVPRGPGERGGRARGASRGDDVLQSRRAGGRVAGVPWSVRPGALRQAGLDLRRADAHVLRRASRSWWASGRGGRSWSSSCRWRCCWAACSSSGTGPPSWLDPRVDRFLMLIDPSGFRWLNETQLKVDRGVAFYNSASIPLDGTIIANRLALPGDRPGRGGFEPVALRQGAPGEVATGRAGVEAGPRAVEARGAGRGARRGRDRSPLESGRWASLGMTSRRPGLIGGAWTVMRAEVRELRSSPGLYLFVPLAGARGAGAEPGRRWGRSTRRSC